MRVLVDTNILARIAHKNHPHSPIANAALSRLWNGYVWHSDFNALPV